MLPFGKLRRHNRGDVGVTHERAREGITLSLAYVSVLPFAHVEFRAVGYQREAVYSVSLSRDGEFSVRCLACALRVAAGEGGGDDRTTVIAAGLQVAFSFGRRRFTTTPQTRLAGVI